MHSGKYFLMLLALVALGCGASESHQIDGGDGDGDGGGGDGNATFVKPEGYASVTFFVDDTANRTYQSGQIQWKGSLVYQPQTNIIEHDPTWAGEQGPYPVLYDDGPIADGGHERPGATAGDHIFSVEVYVKAAEDFETRFQYGAINEWSNWIWEGENGEFVLPAGSTGIIEAQGYYIHAFGTYDLIVTLDSAQLNDDFLPFDPAVDKVYLKGSMNSWAPRQLLDNGEKSDQAAGDGVYTYHHAENLGDHDGMLYAGQHVQFVFMLNQLEYKRIDALSDGVSAQTNCAGPEVWEETPIFMEPESRGRIKNTTVAICEGGGSVSVTSVVPSSGDPAGDTPVAVYGSAFADGAQVTFGGVPADEVVFVDAGQINCATPSHDPGSVAVRVTNPGGEYGELPDGFTYVLGDQPEILFLQPRTGPTGGSTLVSITGRRFMTGAQVTFGSDAAVDVSVTGAQEITCRTPAHAAGKVDVTVTNPGSLSHTFPQGFEYIVSTGPHIQRVEPAVGSTAGGDDVTIIGSGFNAGAVAYFDDFLAQDLVVSPPGAIACKTPAHAAGSVDVKVQNPNTQQGVLADGFRYEQPRVDWAVLKWPLSLVIDAGETSPLVYAQVYESGVTAGAGCGAALTAQLGFGLPGSDPVGDPGSWTWTDAACNDQCSDCGDNDEFQASFQISSGGQYDYAYRFSLDGGQTWVVADSGGTQDGYQPEQAGQATVRGGGSELEVWGVTPESGTVLGGTPITVEGNAFADGAVVSVGGEALSTTFIDANTLRATTPPHSAEAVEVRVTNPDSQFVSLPTGYHYVLRGTPTLDGEIDTGAGSDWNDAFLAGQNNQGGSWSPNHMDRLYVCFDDTNLYLGLAGWVESGIGNAMVVYIDVDYGPGTGVANMNALTDTSAGIDDAISSKCSVTAGGFGAEFAVGTKGMAGAESAELLPDAGLRLLVSPATPDDFHWLASTVITSPTEHGVEAAVPLDALLGGLPPEGARLAVFARLLNADGQFLSNDTLPLDNPASPEEVGSVFVFEVR
jgi:hypothetical protein